MAPPVHHRALREHHALGPDIYEPLFEWVFENDRFKNWLRPENNWQLRCDGSPGSGKTTLSALAARYLRRRFQNEQNVVASIFLVDEVQAKDEKFVPQVLESVLCQLRKSASPGAGAAIEEREANAKVHGRGQDGLREDICSLISFLDHTFLIIDDFNRCDIKVQAAIEQEMRHFQDCGMKIMVTSRAPRPDESIIETYCDCHDCTMSDMQVHVFWKCDTCGFIVCYACKDGGRSCANCGDVPCLRQPYDHVSINIGQLGCLLKDYIAWDLENEHGDLGLGSAFGGLVKPPLSLLGSGLCRSSSGSGGVVMSLIEKLMCQAEGNVCLAKMRLDNLHLLDSIEGLDGQVADRLPANIVAFFDAAIQSIVLQNEKHRTLGLLAISAMSKFPFQCGIDFSTFEDVMREFNRSRVGIVFDCSSIEEVLLATNGFLVMEALEQQPLRAYSHAFYLYVTEDYNELLTWSIVNLRLDNIEWLLRIQRTKTTLMDMEREAMRGQRLEAREIWGSKHDRRDPGQTFALSQHPGARKPARRRTAVI